MNLRLIVIVCLLIVGACDSKEAQSNETKIFVPINSEGGPFGFYAEVEYHEYAKPIEIDFTVPRAGRDLVSVLSNYHYSINAMDGAAYVELFARQNGNREFVQKHIDQLLKIRSRTKFDRVELRGYFNWGKLTAPLIHHEPAGRGSELATCLDNECYLIHGASSRSFGLFYMAINGTYAKYWRPLDEKEQQTFHQIKGQLHRFYIAPEAPEYQAVDNKSSYPTVYLDLKKYDNPRRVSLSQKKEGLSSKMPPEVEPVVRWLELMGSMDRSQRGDKDLLIKVYKKAFDYNQTKKNPNFSLFKLQGDKYARFNRTITQYASAARFWKAIVPVGYLQNGDVKYVYFFPFDDSMEINEVKGENAVQFLPVRKSAQGYKLDIESMPFTPLGPIEFPEAITLINDFFALEN